MVHARIPPNQRKALPRHLTVPYKNAASLLAGCKEA